MKKCATNRNGEPRSSFEQTKEDKNCHLEIKTWKQAVAELTETFLSYQAIMSAVPRARKRADFYSEFRRMSLAAAMSTLAGKNWGGDRIHHSEEIVSACIIGLLKQEQADRGLFRMTLAPFVQLRGYMSQIIWRGVQQKARDHFRKEDPQWNHESLDLNCANFIDEKIGDIGLRIDLKRAIQKVTAEEMVIFQLPGGVIPLDLVLRKEIASTILSQVPKRSWQRYSRQSRERLAKELGYPC